MSSGIQTEWLFCGIWHIYCRLFCGSIEAVASGFHSSKVAKLWCFVCVGVTIKAPMVRIYFLLFGTFLYLFVLGNRNYINCLDKCLCMIYV